MKRIIKANVAPCHIQHKHNNVLWADDGKESLKDFIKRIGLSDKVEITRRGSNFQLKCDDLIEHC